MAAAVVGGCVLHGDGLHKGWVLLEDGYSCPEQAGSCADTYLSAHNLDKFAELAVGIEGSQLQAGDKSSEVEHKDAGAVLGKPALGKLALGQCTQVWALGTSGAPERCRFDHSWAAVAGHRWSEVGHRWQSGAGHTFAGVELDELWQSGGCIDGSIRDQDRTRHRRREIRSQRRKGRNRD